jgi:hypothetical protein
LPRPNRNLAEGERVGLDPATGEGDLEGAVGDGAVLPDELIQPLVGHRAMALAVNVDPVRRARRLFVDEHPVWIPMTANPSFR